MNIFRVEGTDKRNELIAAVDDDKIYVYESQKPSGKNVEYFSPDTGFVLLEETDYLKTSSAFVRRAAACAKLSLGPKLELRETLFMSDALNGDVKVSGILNPSLVTSDYRRIFNTVLGGEPLYSA